MTPRLVPYLSKWPVKVMIVALLYYGAARLGLLLAFEKTNASPVWPPSGIAFAAVLLLGYRVWPGIMVGAFLANAVVFLAYQTFDSLTIIMVSSLIAIGNTLEALTGAFLLHRLVGPGSPLDRAQDVFKFVMVALAMCLVSPSIGPTSISLAGMSPWGLYETIWVTWWLGDVSGVLVVTPLLLTWSRRIRIRWESSRLAEALLMFVLLALAGWLGFAGRITPEQTPYPLAFILIPLLLWAAFRFGQREAATAVALASGIAIWKTVNGSGQFVTGNLNESLLLLQVYVGVVSVTTLATAAVVSERKQAEGKLRENEAKGRAILDTVVDGIITIDERGILQSLNPAAARIFGFAPSEVIGQNISMLMPEPYHSEHDGYLANYLKTGEKKIIGIGREVVGRRKDGTVFPVDIAVSEVRLADRRIFTGIVRDITERKRLEAQLVRLASHDPLTDLFNRRHFHEELEHQLSQARRYGTRAALLFLDLDRFKDVNDRLGHLAGDELLTSLAGVLRERLRETDIVARPGGDEFTILLPHTDADQARAVAEDLLNALRSHTLVVNGHPVGVTGSIGIALLPDHGITVQELLTCVDLAMYQAKENGRNQLAIFTPDKEREARTESRLDW